LAERFPVNSVEFVRRLGEHQDAVGIGFHFDGKGWSGGKPFVI
jgi:hypothetical protein